MSSCHAQQELAQLNQIEFSSQTRGDRLRLTLTENKALLYHNNVKKECTLKKENWVALKETLSDQKIKQASKYISKGKNRFIDRAKITSIKFITDQATYETTSFDDFDAPKEFQALMKEIQKILALKCLTKE